MPIKIQYDAAAVVPPSSNELNKYGGPMLMQQRKYDLEQMRDQQNNQMRMQNYSTMQGYNREPSRAEQAYFRDQAIRSGAFAPGVIKNIRDLEAEQRRVLANRSLNATQMANAMSQIDAQMQVVMSMGYPQQMVEARNQIASGPRQPMTSAQAFAADPKLEEKFMGLVDPNNSDGSPKPYEQRLQEALAMRDAREKILFGQPQGQQAAQPATQTAPVAPPQTAPTQPATQTAPVAPPQTAPTTTPAKKGARGYVPISPQGQSVTALGRNAMYNERGEFVGDPGLYDQQGADYIRQQAGVAQGSSTREWVDSTGQFMARGQVVRMLPQSNQYPDGGAVVLKLENGSETIVPLDRLSQADQDFLVSPEQRSYNARNYDRSQYTNMFDQENPEYAAMRAPAPQQNTSNVGQFKGRYGLGGVDYGINPATGNRVTASIRPGGGLEFDEPVGKPGAAMGGRKGSVTIMGGKKKPVVGVDVTPGVSTPQEQAAYNALPEAPVVSPSAPTAAGADYQYQSPIAQAVASTPQPATPARKYGGSSYTSPAAREVEAAMQAGEELAAREQAAGQQQAFQAMTAPPPVSMSDEKRKELGLPTTKELKEMRRSMDQNKLMGGIGLGGTGRAAGSYSPPASVQKPKESPKAGKQSKPASQQNVMSQAIKDFASKQPSDVQNAIKDAYDTKLSDRLRENAVKFLLSRGIDLDKMSPNS